MKVVADGKCSSEIRSGYSSLYNLFWISEILSEYTRTSEASVNMDYVFSSLESVHAGLRTKSKCQNKISIERVYPVYGSIIPCVHSWGCLQYI